jgi:ribosomal protein S18 acetylase RimI-like enzyme
MTDRALIEIKPLTREIITNNIAAMVDMSRQINQDYWVLEHYLADLEKKWELSFAAYYNGKLCGFIIVSEKPESLHVNRIVVSPDLQKSGVGKMLIEGAIRDAMSQQKRYLTLKVDEINTGAIDFYKKLGFEITGNQGALLLMRLKMN